MSIFSPGDVNEVDLKNRAKRKCHPNNSLASKMAVHAAKAVRGQPRAQEIAAWTASYWGLVVPPEISCFDGLGESVDRSTNCFKNHLMSVKTSTRKAKRNA